MNKQTFKIFGSSLEWLLILSAVLLVQPAKAQDIPKSDLLINQLRFRKTVQQAKSPQAISKIQQLSEVEPTITSAQMLLVQSPTPSSTPQTEVVQVTSVKANPTNRGVEVILKTTKELQVTNRSTGNSFIADVPNAQLRLANGEAFTFRSEKPASGITEITVTNFDANTIRVTVVGEASVPVVELSDSPEEGLIFEVASAISSAQQQPQIQPTVPSQPESQTQPSQGSAEGDQPID